MSNFDDSKAVLVFAVGGWSDGTFKPLDASRYTLTVSDIAGGPVVTTTTNSTKDQSFGSVDFPAGSAVWSVPASNVADTDTVTASSFLDNPNLALVTTTFTEGPATPTLDSVSLNFAQEN